jgi:Domain of unknown function (DUF5679)
MFKRIFWLALAGIGVWMLYRLWQQRQEDFGGTPPLLAPLEPYSRHVPPPATPRPNGGDAPPPAAASAPSAHEDAPPRTAPVDPQDTAAGAGEAIVGYCARCKSRRTISDAREETTDSGRRAARGTCPVCGAKMFTFLPSKTG